MSERAGADDAGRVRGELAGGRRIYWMSDGRKGVGVPAPGTSTLAGRHCRTCRADLSPAHIRHTGTPFLAALRFTATTVALCIGLDDSNKKVTLLTCQSLSEDTFYSQL